MERVAFLIEKTGERIGCLLNPESLTVRRVAGVQRRMLYGAPLNAAAQADDPLLYTGGGITELTLDLLFDTSLAGSTIESDDVRALTRPLWDLSENAAGADGDPEPRIIRFVWGKAFNIPGVIAAIAERLEFFTEAEAPRRSWLRIRLLRANPADTAIQPATPVSGVQDAMTRVRMGMERSASEFEQDRAVEIPGGTDEAASDVRSARTLTRMDEIAYHHFGDASHWRLIAWFNNVVDPLRVPVGKVLHIPPQRASGGA